MPIVVPGFVMKLCPCLKTSCMSERYRKTPSETKCNLCRNIYPDRLIVRDSRISQIGSSSHNHGRHAHELSRGVVAPLQTASAFQAPAAAQYILEISPEHKTVNIFGPPVDAGWGKWSSHAPARATTALPVRPSLPPSPPVTPLASRSPVPRFLPAQRCCYLCQRLSANRPDTDP